MIKLVFIDMSGTLVDGSGANSGADFLGKGDAYREIYPKFKSGDMPMDELLARTYACWEGLSINDLPKVYAKFDFNPGAKETVRAISKRGIRTALLSFIPTHLSELFKKDIGFDFITGTVLEVKDGKFTGNVLAFPEDKGREAMKILARERISQNDAISIGDRKDDAKVFEKVRFGVAFNGDETARKAAKYSIADFRELLSIIEKESADP